jgi:hypothetical protein
LCLLPILTSIRHNSIQAKILKKKGGSKLIQLSILDQSPVAEQQTQAQALQKAYSVDEFMIASLTPDYEQKVEGYRLLAQAFHLN